MPDRLTGAEVASLLDISRSTVYRRMEEGLIPRDWRTATIAPLIGVVTRKRPGPERDRYSRRYTIWRHRFERKDEMNAILLAEARWAHHSNSEGQRYGVTLGAGHMARILGRTCPVGCAGVMFYADLTTDAIECGTRTIWKTGARQAVDAVLASVTPDDLDYGDYIEELLWRCHVRGRGGAADLSGAPDYWRDGKRLSDAERDAMLARQEAQRGLFAERGVLEGVRR
jgi:hypothetical protein